MKKLLIKKKIFSKRKTFQKGKGMRNTFSNKKGQTCYKTCNFFNKCNKLSNNKKRKIQNHLGKGFGYEYPHNKANMCGDRNKKSLYNYIRNLSNNTDYLYIIDCHTETLRIMKEMDILVNHNCLNSDNPVLAAGIIRRVDNHIIINNCSGHYQPHKKSLKYLKNILREGFKEIKTEPAENCTRYPENNILEELKQVVFKIQ